MNGRITWEDNGTQGSEGGSLYLQSSHALNVDPPELGEEDRLELKSRILRRRYECLDGEKSRTQDPGEKLRIIGILEKIINVGISVDKRRVKLAGREVYLAGIEAMEAIETAREASRQVLVYSAVTEPEAYRALMEEEGDEAMHKAVMEGVGNYEGASSAERGIPSEMMEAMRETEEATVEPKRVYEAALKKFERITGRMIGV